MSELIKRKNSWEFKFGTKEFNAAKKYANDMCKARERVIRAAKRWNDTYSDAHIKARASLCRAVNALLKLEKSK